MTLQKLVLGEGGQAEVQDMDPAEEAEFISAAAGRADAYAAQEVRARRDALLAACDWTQVPDAPLDSALREAWQSYRQALRDVPQQPGFPHTVTWPEPPA